MVKIVSVAHIREIEAAAAAMGLTYATLMQNAGLAVAGRAIARISAISNPRVTVLVGAGNNGGDGLVAGLVIARETQALVRFYLLKNRPDDDPNFDAVRSANLPVAFAADDRDGRVLRNMVASADILVDALFGIGIKLPLRSDVAKVLRTVNLALNDMQRPEQSQGIVINPTYPASQPRLSKPYVIAVDCPSGLDCDTGALDSNTIFADETVTFIAVKKGLLEFPGAAAVGQLQIATIGIPEDFPELKVIRHTLAHAAEVKDLLPNRPSNANKGTFGKLLIVAGSVKYVGAAGLTAMSAYRSGAGLVTVAAPQTVVAALSGHFLEPTWLPLPEADGNIADDASAILLHELSTYSAVLLGPGWGRAKATENILLKLLSKPLPPLVIDADGLNILSEIQEWWKQLPPQTVITPHPGEMGRLANMPTDAVQADRWKIAAEKAAEWNVILVLKGAHTLIAAPDGRIVALPFKSDALSTAGTGDVLAGLISGLLAQGLKSFDAAVLGAYVHGLAGEVAARQQGNNRSVIAGDVLNAIGAVLSDLDP